MRELRVLARALLLTLAAAGLLSLGPAAARADVTPDAALAHLVDEARATVAAPGGCAQPGLDRLVRIVCAGRIRIGVRESYPLFATRSGETRHGYEIDAARAVAGKLGVEVDFVKVKAATRIPLLADGTVDLVIATMGHNTQRESQVRFIRPHYYQSETLLVGAHDLAVSGWPDIHGLTVCVTVGNASNAELVSRGVAATGWRARST